MSGITVVTPTHPARQRNGMLARAEASVATQTLQPARHLVVVDQEQRGAAATRQRGLEQVDTEWVAFLDSDDELDPTHLEQLFTCAQATGADYVYPWFRVVGGSDPFPMFYGRPWDDDQPHQTTITILVRTGLAQLVGFHEPPPASTVGGHRGGEDWHFTLGCLAAGACIVHHPQRTWTWHHHGANTSGEPTRGDARPGNRYTRHR